MISDEFSSVYNDEIEENNSENLDDSVEEIITHISELDNKHSYTIARVIENGKCIELHYNEGMVTLEYGIKVAEDMWENEINSNVEWFNLDLTDDEILENLNKEYDFDYDH